MAARACVLLAVTWTAFFTPVAASGQTVTGIAVALDGDTLAIGSRQVRLFGIDAPEFSQTCQRGGETWSCGEAAKEQLAALVQGASLECRGVAVDTYGRTVATCTAGYVDINGRMVADGWAIAYREYSDAYVAAEHQAKRKRLGIWDSEFVMPSEYRTPHRSVEPTSRRSFAPVRRAQAGSPTGCAIKGNRNRKGQWIYHLPGMPYYDVTRPEEMFCTEGEARAAGYRRAIVRP